MTDSRRRPTPSLLAAALLLSGLAAQDRDLVAGRVLTRDGEPWAGADVVLAALPMPAAPELGDVDRVEVQTSASGIFRARVIPELSYVAWAATITDDGRLRSTPLVRDLRPGATVELAEGEPIRDPRLVVRGLEAWNDHGPFEVALRSEVSELGVAILELDERGEAPLPAWPETNLIVEIRGADGQPLHLARTYARGAAARGLAKTLVPPPHPLPVVVRDADGDPIAGARIRYDVGSIWTDDWPGEAFGTVQRRIWREGPRTDETGRATIQIPTAADPLDPNARGRGTELLLEATKDGFARSHSGMSNGKLFVDGVRLEDSEQVTPRTELPFTLTAPRPIRGKLERAHGMPLAEHSVLITMTSKVAYRNGWRHVPRRFLVSTDADGVFTLADPPPDGYQVGFHFALPAALHRAWAADTIGLLGRTGMAAEPFDVAQGAFPAVTLSTFREVRIATGGDAAGPKPRRTVAVIPIGAQEREEIPDVPWLAATDVAGRVALRLPPGRYGLLSLEPTSFVAAEFDVGAEPGPLELELPARDFAWMRMHIETADGPATAGDVSVRTMSQTVLVDQAPVPLGNLLQEISGNLVNSARIDAGRLDIPIFPDLPGLEIGFVVSLPGGRESPLIDLAPTVERVTLRIQ